MEPTNKTSYGCFSFFKKDKPIEEKNKTAEVAATKFEKTPSYSDLRILGNLENYELNSIDPKSS